MRLYSEFASWFHLLTHPDDYVAEAADYTRLLQGAVPGARTLLELGAGGGNNAFHMKRQFTCTLSDLSPAMLELCRTINPECEHVEGDMRSLRLGRQFDVVFAHDALDYMATADDLQRAIATAFVHTRPGGAALLVPDCTAETFAPGEECGGHDGPDDRALRYLAWTFDPDPTDRTHEVHFVYLLRENGRVRVEHDAHVYGVFERREWLEMMREAGFAVTTPGLDPELHEGQVAFLCRRPP